MENRMLIVKEIQNGKSQREVSKRYNVSRCAINNKQLKARIAWCRQHKHFPTTRFQNVIYSDECRMELHPNRRQYVRRPKGTRLKDRYTTKTVKFGGKSLMIWGCVKYNGDRMLIRCNGNVDSAEYQRILCEGLLPHYDPEEEFMHDGAPCHRSRSTSLFLSENNIRLFKNAPPQSPDLNIIENIWAELKLAV